MKKFVNTLFAIAVAAVALSAHAQAQTVSLNALGSSALFLQLGLAASSSTAFNASCVWTGNNSTIISEDGTTTVSNAVSATDTTTSSTIVDKGNAWVAWTKGSDGTCATAGTIYAYLQTDSVVGNRCLYNVNKASGGTCTIAYPITTLTTTGLMPTSAGLILGKTAEVALPYTVANALNSAAVNAAGTDIRPEDAEFAITRATTTCGSAVATGSQYLGLGYTAGSTINSAVSSSTFGVVPFTLPASYSVTPVGAVPVLVVVNGDGTSTGLNSLTNLTSQQLAYYLDGTYSYTQPGATSGSTAKVFIREPLSGTYNTMEYNVPNTLTLNTSQDVGVNQSTTLRNCNATTNLPINPMVIGARKRTIGTGQELAQVVANTNSLGYGFWSTANFKGFTTAATPNAKYLTIDGIDPILSSDATYTGTIPNAVDHTADLANVDLHNTANGSYPIWSLLRLVNLGSSPLAVVSNLATAAQAYVSFGTSTSVPDFVTTSNLTVVRSHFVPPAGDGLPTTAANGHVGISSSYCSATEVGGDVGGVVYTLTADSSYCHTHSVTTGHTGNRR